MYNMCDDGDNTEATQSVEDGARMEYTIILWMTHYLPEYFHTVASSSC